MKKIEEGSWVVYVSEDCIQIKNTLREEHYTIMSSGRFFLPYTALIQEQVESHQTRKEFTVGEFDAVNRKLVVIKERDAQIRKLLDQ